MMSNLSSDKPVCVAIIICNDIIEDKRTSNKTLVGLFDSLAVPSLPAMQPRLFLMASLTNLGENEPISFSVKSPTGKEILHMDGEASSEGERLGTIDLVVEVLGLTVGELGIHSVEVLAGDTLLGSRRFTVQRQS